MRPQHPGTIGLADLLRGGAPDTTPGCLVAIDLAGVDWRRAEEYAGGLAAALGGPAGGRRQRVVVGVAPEPLPRTASGVIAQLDCTLGTGPAAYCAGSAADLALVAETVAAAPLAATTLVGVLVVTGGLDVDDGLAVESLAYSMLLGGPEFTTWRDRTPRHAVADAPDPVVLERTDGVLSVVLNRPARRNAFGRAVRDGLLDALELVLLDPSIDQVVISGAGPSFCSGGDLDEFGTTDPALAHLVRLERSPGRAVTALGDRIRFELHGACVGAGIEVPAFATQVAARPDARFWLPELRMGLIPGAGGTVSLTRRIGRWRTAWLALTGRAVDVRTALAWGLIDDVL